MTTVEWIKNRISSQNLYILSQEADVERALKNIEKAKELVTQLEEDLKRLEK